MTDACARAVNPVLLTVLDLDAAWRSGGPPFDAGADRVRAAFQELFRAYPPAVGPARPAARDLLAGGPDPAAAYLGLAYPVACLADELLTAHPAVGPRWTEWKLEADFFGTNDRAWQFWAQAELALARPADDIEVFLTCAGLGFRGDKLDDPAGLARWSRQARDRVLDALRLPAPTPPALPHPAAAPPLRGASRLRRAGVVAALALVVAVPAAAAIVAQPFAR